MVRGIFDDITIVVLGVPPTAPVGACAVTLVVFDSLQPRGL